MGRPSTVDVDLAAVTANAAALAAAAQGARLCAVVKADGYGHGAVAVARAALDGGAEWLAVAMVEEGLELREAGIGAPVLVLSLEDGMGHGSGRAPAGFPLHDATSRCRAELAGFAPTAGGDLNGVGVAIVPLAPVCTPRWRITSSSLPSRTKAPTARAPFSVASPLSQSNR